MVLYRLSNTHMNMGTSKTWVSISFKIHVQTAQCTKKCTDTVKAQCACSFFFWTGLTGLGTATAAQSNVTMTPGHMKILPLFCRKPHYSQKCSTTLRSEQVLSSPHINSWKKCLFYTVFQKVWFHVLHVTDGCEHESETIYERADVHFNHHMLSTKDHDITLCGNHLNLRVYNA